MKGDRELLRQHDKPDPKAPQSKSNQTAPALSVDPKATAAVLLKLLDDQLLASEAQTANAKTAASSSELLTDDTQGAPKHISARYAADGLPPGFDTGHTETPMPANQGPFSSAIPTAAPDMQTFLQRFAALAAGRPGATIAAGGDGARKLNMLGAIGGRGGAMIIAVIVCVLWMISGLAPG
jgi:hypothetical protein